MSKVSILMNCYNGGEYLEEAIDSVYSQTFTDWEIVFIDNCSTDNSAEIAKSYGEKIKYYKTEKNIPLGAARNFGIKYCNGIYLAFLDTDDIWFKNTLEIMISNIENSEYAVIYGGHININTNGKQIGKLIPSKKDGNIFPNLLLQYDVPIVASIINLNKFKESEILFIEHFTMFEDYALFLEMASLFPMKALDQELLYYRIHNNSSSTKYIENWASERRYTLDKIIKQNEALFIKYSIEFKEAYARANYYDAIYYMSIGEQKNALKSLSEVKFISNTYFILWVMLFLPKVFWNTLQIIKYKRKF